MSDIERQIIEHYGIDAADATLCPACDLWHRAGFDCPPVLPLETAWYA